MTLNLDTRAANIVRQSLRTTIALNESTLDSIRRMSMRKAAEHEAAATMASTRIVVCRALLDELDRAEVIGS